MSIRQIIVVSTTKTQPKVLNSAASTWGQLQDALASDFGNLSSMRAVVKETRNDLTSPEAVLPEGNFTLFLSPKQIKAGGVDLVAALEALKQKWNNAIDELIEEAEDGEYDSEDEDEEEEYFTTSYKAKSAPVKGISAEDKAILEQLKNGSF